ncbi:MAG: glycosyltransferase family 4 protein [Rhodospirillales bacterium]|nr:glycosyltransferase family 4 protein [Rhodospirillales bacterium]
MAEVSVAVILKGYPRLSETFIAQELLGLERAGLKLHLYSLRAPTDPARHPIHDEIRAPVVYLPEYLKDAPLRVLKAWWRQRRRPGYRAARRAFLRDLKRERTPNRGRRFGQALVLADCLQAGCTQIYAHFLHTPASVARYTALIAGLSWACSAHAKDIWTSPDWEKQEKLAELAWLVTCTGAGYRHLRDLAADPDKVHLVHHGIDLSRFPPPGQKRQTFPGEPVRLLSVGRVAIKKGYDDLLTALARLPSDRPWHLTHIGGGGELARLQAAAGRLGLAGRIDWCGPQPQERVLEAYRNADLFVLASKVAADGDRDGLPNVLMEAQSQGLACLATQLPGIEELILDGETGCLVPPADPEALASALSALIADPERRRTLGQSGQERVRCLFDAEACLEGLLQRFGIGVAAAVETAAAGAR